MSRAKKVIVGGLALLVGFSAGFVVHLYRYPREVFTKQYQKVVGEAGEYHWLHRRQLSTPEQADIPRPNNDTLYSYCMVDVAKHPVIVEGPASDRYWSIQFMADNTDSFYYLGVRTLGLNQPGKVLLVSKDYTGKTEGLQVVHAPSDRVWLMARIVVDGPDDIPRVVQLQDQLKCTIFN